MFILTQFFTDASREISRRASFCVVVDVIVVIIVVVVVAVSRCEAMQSRNNVLSM